MRAMKPKKEQIHKGQLLKELREAAKMFDAGYPLPSGTLLRSQYLASLCRDAATLLGARK
jgi:hypothetical protein